MTVVRDFQMVTNGILQKQRDFPINTLNFDVEIHDTYLMLTNPYRFYLSILHCS